MSDTKAENTSEPKAGKKRKNQERDEDYEEKINDGYYVEAPAEMTRKRVNREHFVYYVDANQKMLPIIRCRYCGTILKGPTGGNLKRHANKECVKHSWTPQELSEFLKESVSKYVVRTGCSFRSTEAPGFQELLLKCIKFGSPGANVDKSLFPSRKVTKDGVEEQCDKIISEIGEQIAPLVRSQKASLLLDFGKHVEDYLCIFIAFVDEESATLKVLPFAFSPSFSSKTAENVLELVLAAADKFGITSDEIRALPLISDGGGNVRKLGRKYFKEWMLCSCHSLQKASEHVLKLREDMKYLFTEQEKHELKLCTDVMNQCAHLSQYINSHKKKFLDTRSPHVYVATRWLSMFYCARDIKEVLHLLLYSDDSEAKKTAKYLKDNVEKLDCTIEVFAKFEPLLLYFEKSECSVHLFLPFLYATNQFFAMEFERSIPDSTRYTLMKSASLITEHCLNNKMSSLHYKATMFHPRYKKMSMMPDEYKNKALEYVRDDLRKLEKDDILPFQHQISDSESVVYQFCDEVMEQTGEEELQEYMSESVAGFTPDSCPLKYWISKKTQYPKLSKVALSSLSVLSSESLCERGFSAVKRVVTDNRHSLDPVFVEKLMLAFFQTNNYT